jgi:hypothetical protein
MRRVGLATPLPTLERGCVACCSRGVWFSCAVVPLSGRAAQRPGGGGGGRLQGAGPWGRAAAAAGAVAAGTALLGACKHGMSSVYLIKRLCQRRQPAEGAQVAQSVTALCSGSADRGHQHRAYLGDSAASRQPLISITICSSAESGLLDPPQVCPRLLRT